MHLLSNLPHRAWLLLLSFGLPVSLSACQRGQTQTLPPPLPQAAQIQVYTNHEPAASYTEPYRQQTRAGDDLEQIIVDAIATARTRVEVAVQELRLPKVAKALVERRQAGVKVRVILENTYSRPFSRFTAAEVDRLPEREQSRYAESRQLIDRNQDGQLSADEINQGDALVMLDQAKIPRLDDTADGSAGSNLMHHKFVAIDGQTLIVTSANFTPSDIHGDLKTPDSRGNANSLLKIESPELAARFTQEFNLMWGDGVGRTANSKFGTKKPFRPAQQVMVGSTLVELQFSPSVPAIPWAQSSNGLISKTLATATQTIAMALFVFSDQKLVNSLEPLPAKGVDIRGLIDPGFAYRSYSEALDMLGLTLAEDCKSEPGNRPWKTPLSTIGVPRLPPGDLLHHKFGIVDQAIVIMGSHNWTEAANTGNDETLLVVHSPIVAAHYQREFDRLYADAILGIPPAIQKKATAQAQTCPQLQPRPSKSVFDESPLSDAEVPIETGTKSRQRTTTKVRTESPSAPSRPAPQQRVNLNTATQAELEALPGIGTGLAKRIIAARQQKPFTSLADLDRVPGVGAKLLKKLESQVTW